MLHYSIRNSDQAIVKGFNGWKAHLARNRTLAGAAHQWKRINDLFEQGQIRFDNTSLADEAMLCAQKAPPETWSDNARP